MKKLSIAIVVAAMLAAVSCEKEKYGYAPVYGTIQCMTENPSVGDTCILQLTVKTPGAYYYSATLKWNGQNGKFLRPDLPSDLCKVNTIEISGGNPKAEIKYVDPEQYTPYIKWVPSKAGTFEFTVSGSTRLSVPDEISGALYANIAQVSGKVTVSAAD